MKSEKIQLEQTYTIDLSKIDGEGDFLCPRCGTEISPNDETENAYSILEPKVNGSDLEEMLIRCNRCGSQINLTGFYLERELSIADEERALTNRLCYITHI